MEDKMKKLLIAFTLLLLITGGNQLFAKDGKKYLDYTSKVVIDNSQDTDHSSSEISIKVNGDEHVAFGDDLTVEKGETVDDLAVFGGDLIVKGTVDGDVAVFGGDITVHKGGLIDGDAACFGGEITQMAGGKISGDKVELNLASGLKNLFHFKYLGPIIGGGVGSLFAFKLLAGVSKFFVLLVLGLLLLAFLEKPTFVVKNALFKNPLACLGYGFLAMLAFVPIIILMAISILGIPLIPLFILIFVFAAFYGAIAFSLFVGEKISQKVMPIKSTALQFVVGLLLLFILGLIPFISFIVCILATMLSLGAVVTTRFGRVEVRCPNNQNKETAVIENKEPKENNNA